MNKINLFNLFLAIWVTIVFFVLFSALFKEKDFKSWKSDKHQIIFWVIFVIIILLFIFLNNFDLGKISEFFDVNRPPGDYR